MECPVCPVCPECPACPSGDFIERNGTWLLTVIGMVVGCWGGILTYFLKSRCRKIRCWGVECVRDVVALDPKDVQIVTNSN